MQVDVSSLKISMGDFAFHIPKWNLPAQSHLLIEGPSGVGKTTFLHLLAGLVPFKEGEISIHKTSIKNLSSRELIDFRRKNFGIIFQKIHLLPHLTLQENILIGCQTQEQVQSLSQLIEALNLKSRMQHKPAELSLGETQRAAVARALISKPSLILADEPTSGLDDSNADKVMQLLKMAAKGKGLIVVSHDARVKKHFDQTLNFQGLLK